MISISFPRKVLLLVVLIAITLLLSRQHITSLYRSHTTNIVTDTFNVGLGQRYGDDQWGLRGKQTAQLIKWGEYIAEHPDLDVIPFLNAMLRVYPFLGGALERIGMPWIGWASPANVGIVMSVGSGNFALALHLIANLRTVLDCKVPIAITYAGDKDLKPKEREILGDAAYDISFIDLLQTFPQAQSDLLQSGWASKPFALLAAPFAKVILVDADAIFLQNPDTLFEVDPGLKKTGALFYHDRAAFLVDDKKQVYLEEQFAAAGMQASEQLQHESLFWAKKAYYEADSGLVALDKSRVGVFMGLVFSSWMNTRSVRDKVTHPVYYGDKEAYWIAMELCGVPYSFPQWYAGSLGTVSFSEEDNSSAETFKDGDAVQMCGKHMLHADHTGQRPFWFNGGIYENKLDRSKGFAHLTHYWLQPDKLSDRVPRWSWQNGDEACIKERGTHVLSKQDVETIAKIINEAQKIEDKTKKPTVQVSFAE